MPDILVTVSAVLFGVAGSGLLGRWIAGIVPKPSACNFAQKKRSLLVILPAHNEERTIKATLNSVKQAAGNAGVPLRIFVGADACHDATFRTARECGAETFEVMFRSKWRTMQFLMEKAGDTDWVALVDSGAMWPGGLLVDLEKHFQDMQLLGIAPAYFPQGASRLEKKLWELEAKLKNQENKFGGPVSSHGATVFYRGDVLKTALKFLQEKTEAPWLNDDVVLPLAVRISFPGGRFQYFHPENPLLRISDEGLREEAPQFFRRLRMVSGNLQWLLKLWPLCWRKNPVAAAIAIRRVIRIFWAYGMLAFAFLAARLFVETEFSAFLFMLGFLIGGSLPFWLAGRRSIPSAALASLLAPVLLFVNRGNPPARWS